MQVVERVIEALAPYLQAVEEQLRNVSDDTGEQMREITRHMVDAGGKRLRPIMTLLSAYVFSEDVSKTVPIAAATELIHMATLAHDDVIDGAQTRRGRATVNSRWDNHTAVLAGDVLLARALVLLVDHGSPAIVRVMSDMIRRMCDGGNRAEGVAAPARPVGAGLLRPHRKEDGALFRRLLRGGGHAPGRARAPGAGAGGVRPEHRHGLPSRR
jgi:Geranylgeranyl pyrophosphate synthase